MYLISRVFACTFQIFWPTVHHEDSSGLYTYLPTSFGLGVISSVIGNLTTLIFMHIYRRDPPHLLYFVENFQAQYAVLQITTLASLLLALSKVESTQIVTTRSNLCSINRKHDPTYHQTPIRKGVVYQHCCVALCFKTLLIVIVCAQQFRFENVLA